MPYQLLARGAGAGAGGLRLFDLAPVVIVGRHDAAAFEQALEARCARTFFRASGRHRGGDPVGDFVAVGTVGADGSGRAAAGPADGIQPVGDPPLLVEELAAALVVGNAVDAWR